MQKSDKCSDIMRTSLALIAEHGFHGTSISMIAEQANVGTGTIYRYFESKDALIARIYWEVEDKIRVAIQKGYDPTKPLRERFIHISTTLLKSFISHPLYFRYIEQYHNSPYGVSLRRDRMQEKSKHNLFEEIFDEGIAQQVLKDLPIIVLFALGLGPLIVLMRDHTLGFVILDDALISKTVEACWNGIKM